MEKLRSVVCSSEETPANPDNVKPFEHIDKTYETEYLVDTKKYEPIEVSTKIPTIFTDCEDTVEASCNADETIDKSEDAPTCTHPNCALVTCFDVSESTRTAAKRRDEASPTSKEPYDPKCLKETKKYTTNTNLSEEEVDKSHTKRTPDPYLFKIDTPEATVRSDTHIHSEKRLDIVEYTVDTAESAVTKNSQRKKVSKKRKKPKIRCKKHGLARPPWYTSHRPTP